MKVSQYQKKGLDSTLYQYACILRERFTQIFHVVCITKEYDLMLVHYLIRIRTLH